MREDKKRGRNEKGKDAYIVIHVRLNGTPEGVF